MFGSEVFEIAIGLILIFLFVSLICTALIEAIESILKYRAMDLERGIRELLDDRDGTGITQQLFAHPLIFGLYAGEYDPDNLRGKPQIGDLWPWSAGNTPDSSTNTPTNGKGVSVADAETPVADADQPAAGAVQRAQAANPQDQFVDAQDQNTVTNAHSTRTENSVAADQKNTSAAKHMRIRSRRNLPSYIPASNFSGAIIDIVMRGAFDDKAVPSSEELTFDNLRKKVSDLPSKRLQRVVLAALDTSQGDIAKVKANLEAWYNASMDRISGWYKRRTQYVLFAIGFVVAISMNIDALTVARRLSETPALREAVLAQAEAITRPNDGASGVPQELKVETIAQLRERMQLIGYPVGWDDPLPQCRVVGQVQEAGGQVPVDPCVIGGVNWVAMFGGWLITALAVMLGAPFWFDLLNKFMVIRATVKPREKSQEEGSEDRQNAKAKP
jgi:hypothetical protein